MTLDDLIAEARALARPHAVLSGNGEGRLAGYWRGERADRPNGVPEGARALKRYEHLLTVDEALLSELGISCPSPFCLFEVELQNGDAGCRVERVPAFADTSCSGRALNSVYGTSWPPFEGICLYGSQKVADWLSSLGLERHQYAHVLGEAVALEYEDAWLEQSPFHSHEGDVVVGGWHFVWPDDDFFMPLEMRLVLCTLAEGEPFREVWLSETGNLLIKERIT